MRSEITKLHERLETTFIYVTHDQTEAMTMGNRIVVMKDGFIQQADTPITLFEDPCNLFVATFLGSPQMNIVDAELFLDGGVLKAKLNDAEGMVVTFPEIKAKQLASKKYIGQKVLLGIRPEHVRPMKGDLKRFVEVVEHLGDESILYAKMENRKDPFIIKIPFNSKIHANEDINVEFDMNHVYLFDAETHKAIMGIPAEDELPANIIDKVINVGDQAVVIDEEYRNHLLDNAFDKEVFLGFKPEYVSLEEQPNSLNLTAKLEFVEQKTDYQAVYFSLKGLEGYFALKMRNEEEVKLGQEVELYIPYQRINVYDEEHNKLNSREVVYPNVVNGTVKNNKDSMVIKLGDASLVYPSEGLEDGEYEITIKQDALKPLFTKKMWKLLNKSGYEYPEMDNASNVLKVSAYDEDVLGSKLLAYVAINGFEHYASFVMDNNFSVYKMPKFSLYVPREALVLKKK
jgi:ABC-type sugar transport system ATPase subunit